MVIHDCQPLSSVIRSVRPGDFDTLGADPAVVVLQQARHHRADVVRVARRAQGGDALDIVLERGRILERAATEIRFDRTSPTAAADSSRLLPEPTT